MSTSHRLVIAFLALAASSNAANLKQAEFTRVINDVRVMPAQQQPAPAKIGDKISGQTAVSTGVASRAELRFPDKTLTRIGSNSLFKLDRADRTLDLEKGVILLQVPKQLGGAKVRTAAVTAAVTGTSIMIEYDPITRIIKIIVLEGEVELYFNADPSNFITLVAGDILVFRDDAKRFPRPGKVDLALLRKTSKLMDPTEFEPLINQRQLAAALDVQGELKNKGELLKTAFQIVGRGTKITLTTEARDNIFKSVVFQSRSTGNSGGGSRGGPLLGGFGSDTPGSVGNIFANALGTTIPGSSDNGNGFTGTRGNGGSGSSGGVITGSVGINLGGSGGGTTLIPSYPGTTVFNHGSSIYTNPHATAYNSIPDAVVTMDGSIYVPGTHGLFNSYMFSGAAQTFPGVDSFLSSHGDWFVFRGDEIYISGDIAVNSDAGPRNLILGATGDVNFSHYTPYDLTTDSSWTLPSSVDALLISSQHGSITVGSSFSLLGSGGPQDVAFYAYGPTSDVSLYGPSYSPLIEGGGTGEFFLSGIYLPYGTFQAYAGRDIVTDAAVIEAREINLKAQHDVKIDNRSSIRPKTLLLIEALENIQIQNSSQLVALSLVDPLTIMLKAVNGNIEISESFVDAANVEMVSGLGNVSMMNSSIAADVIKARVMSTGGELLVSNSILGRDTPSAASLIKLYGEGASGVRFNGDNTLNAALVDIAGRSVTIDSGGVVRLSHPGNTRVFTDNDNFNKGSFGNFTTKGGTPVNVTKDAFDNRPGY